MQSYSLNIDAFNIEKSCIFVFELIKISFSNKIADLTTNSTPCFFMNQFMRKGFFQQFLLAFSGKFSLILLLSFLPMLLASSNEQAADSLIRYVKQENPTDTVRFTQLLEAAKSLSRSKLFRTLTAKVDSLYYATRILALQHNWEHEFLLSIDSIGTFERNQANYESAIFWHQKGLKLSDSLGLITEKIKALNNLGLVHNRLDDYRQASDYYLSALALANKINDNASYFLAANGLGNIQFILGNYEAALHRFRECLSYEQKRNNLAGVAINLNNIGNVFLRREEIDKAMEYFLLSLEVNREAGSEHGVAICYSDLGQVYRFKKEYPKALNYFLLSLELNEKIGQLYYLANSYINVAEVYVIVDNYEQAMLYIEKGIAAAEQSNSLALLERAYQLIYQINKDKGNYAEALRYFENADVIGDSILNNTISRTVIQMQTLFDRERSETQIALLKHQKELAELQMRDQKLINWFGISILIVLLVALLVGIYLFRLKSHSNKLLQSQKEEVEKAQQELSVYADKLLVAKEEAERHNALKSQFLANMSHEIRTPMNSIIGFADILEKLIDDPQQKSYLDSMRSSSRSLLLLINDILDLSKIEADKLQIKNEPLDLRQLFQEIKQLFLLQLREKHLTFDIRVDEKLPKLVFLSETRMRQVLFNLVGNAIKFTHKGGIHLRLAISRTNSELSNDIHLTIKDTGIGIAADGLDKIFEAFYQHQENASQYRGTGLGLAITQRLVTAMNGSVTVVSELNKGATFKVLLRDVRIIKDEYWTETTTKSSRSQSLALLPKLYVLSRNKTHNQLIGELASDLNLKLVERMPRDEQLQEISMQNGAIVFFDMNDYGNISPFVLNQILHANNIRTALLGSRHQIAELRLNPDFQFDLPAQQSLLKRFLQTEINKAEAGLSDFNGAIKLPGAKNQEEELALKKLDTMWQEAQSSNFMVDAEELAIQLISLSKKFKWINLEQFGLKLKNAAEGFDIEQTKLLLNQYEADKQSTGNP